MESVAGRAAHAIEQLCGIKLPFVHPRITERELDRVAQEARVGLEIYRTAIRATYETVPLTQEQEKTIQKIAKKITFTSDKLEVTFPSQHLFHQILLEWRPIGRKAEEFEKLLNVKSSEEEFGFRYTFITDGDKFVSHYSFHTDSDGRVKSIFVSGEN